MSWTADSEILTRKIAPVIQEVLLNEPESGYLEMVEFAGPIYYIVGKQHIVQVGTASSVYDMNGEFVCSYRYPKDNPTEEEKTKEDWLRRFIGGYKSIAKFYPDHVEVAL